MPANPDVVEELRTMFKTGATPSKLIQHSHSRHPDAHGWRVLVQDYFWETFAVPTIRVSTNPEDYRAGGISHSHLNRDLVHRMSQSGNKWDSESDALAHSQHSWLESLVATNDSDAIEHAQPANVPELAPSWPHLNEGTRKYIQELMGNVHSLQERVIILAQLAEEGKSPDGQAVSQFYVERTFLDTLRDDGPEWKLDDAKYLEETIGDPDVIFEGLNRLGMEDAVAYAVRPPQETEKTEAQGPPRYGYAFVGYARPGTWGYIIFDWEWREEDPDEPGYPVGWEADFTRRSWYKT